MRENDIPLLETRRQILRLNFLQSLIKRELSIDPALYVTPLSTRRTRHDHTHALTPHFARTDIYKYSFFPRTVSEWNSRHVMNDPF